MQSRPPGGAAASHYRIFAEQSRPLQDFCRASSATTGFLLFNAEQARPLLFNEILEYIQADGGFQNLIKK